MNDEGDRTEVIEQETLSAYLDGELDAEARRGLEQRLADDPHLLQRLHQYERAWELLDELPREGASDDFTHSTVEMVAVAAAGDAKKPFAGSALWPRLAWLASGGGMAAAAVAGFLLVAGLLSAPDRQLVEDLPVIENLDAYRHAESIEFLRALDHEGLFAGEVEDAL